MKDQEITKLIQENAPIILAEINKAKSILLHCHPSPDPDSTGSALAMKFALEGMGKKVTVIKGDSDIPEDFAHFPGYDSIVKKNFFEIDHKEYDLFIILDSASSDMISRVKPIEFPASMRTVVIDHHASNKGFAEINLIETSYPATSQILADLFTLWNVKITKEIAINLFMGIYTDTGGFKYLTTTPKTFGVANSLINVATDFPKYISIMENSKRPGDLAFEALALNSIEVFFGGKLALSLVSAKALADKGLDDSYISASLISTIMRTVKNWSVTGCIVETQKGVIQMSFRSNDQDGYNVAKLAMALGGGGHIRAAGVSLPNTTLDTAKELIVTKAKELFNL